jgi:YjbR
MSAAVSLVGSLCQIVGVPERPDVPLEWIERLRAVFADLPECVEEDAWTGVSWQVGRATVAHVFGGEDQLFRITFRADPAEVMAFRHLGAPYFRATWGRNVVGLLLDESTDWTELAELLTDSYCLQAPARLADLVARPGA